MTAQDLKNSILQLAVQGKLVPQDPSDEPASVFLKRFTGESIQENDDTVLPFDIPSSWEWVKLGVLVSVIGGTSYKSNETAKTGVRILRGGNIQKSEVLYFDNDVFLPTSFLDAEKIIRNGDVLIVASTGSKTVIGKPGFVFSDDGNTQIGAFLRIVRPKYLELAPYIRTIFDSEYYRSHIRNQVQGMNINNVKNEHITEFIVPIPPLAEQERIVAKIEELTPLVEEYGKTEGKIQALNAEFPDKLRKSILQQAVQGKLTECDPSDEPASELLKRIRTEKAKLITEGKIKKEKPLPPITDEEKPFDIPDTWEWERVGNLFSVIRGSSPRPKGSPLYWSSKETEFHWVTIKDISDHTQNGVMYKTHEYLTELGSTLSTYVEKGELIVAVSGSTTGKFCVLGINGFIYDGLAAVLNPIKIISSEYLKVFYSWVYQILNSKKIGSAFPNINTDVLKNTLIPIPPLEEQKRIVARVEELLAVCDGLK